MQKRDLIQANASLENLRQNLDMKDFAKEILLEENYNKFIRSYKFTFWFQLIGVLAGFIVPSVVLLIIFKEYSCNHTHTEQGSTCGKIFGAGKIQPCPDRLCHSV